MNLIHIAYRIAGPTIDILKDIKGENINQLLNEAIEHVGDDEKAYDVIIKSIERIYGSDIAKEINETEISQRLDDTSPNPNILVHEVMHKIAEPDFLLNAMQGTTQSNKSPTEAIVDEMIIGYLENEEVQDFDNLFTLFLNQNQWDSVNSLLEDLNSPKSNLEVSKVLKGAASWLKRTRPELLNKTTKDIIKDQYGKDRSAVELAAWAVQDYISEKVPQLADILLSDVQESKFKQFINLTLSRLKKMTPTY